MDNKDISIYILIFTFLGCVIWFNNTHIIIHKNSVSEIGTDVCGEIFGGTGYNCIIYDINYEGKPIDTPTEKSGAILFKKWKVSQCKKFIEVNENK